MAISLRFHGSIALLTLAAAACQTTPRLLGRDTQVTLGPLEQLNPSDVAVAPIRLTMGAEKAPVEALRRAAQVGLARRRYSPLSASLVDATVEAASGSIAGIPGEATADATMGPATGEVMEAGFTASYAPGDLGEDAVLQVTVTRWDDRHWAVRRRVSVGIEARMIDPADPFGPPLWAGSLDREFEPGTSVGGTMLSAKAQDVIAEEIFRELLVRMPAREIDPAGLLIDGMSPGSDGRTSGGAERDGDVESPQVPAEPWVPARMAPGTAPSSAAGPSSGSSSGPSSGPGGF